jgi:hypothetical protein
LAKSFRQEEFYAKHISKAQPMSVLLPQILTSKGQRGVFLQKRSKSTISSSRSPNEFLFTILQFQP